MADADVAITAGTGTKVDTRTVGAGTDEHRQVVVIGDPATAANVASADATNGLDVDVTRVQGTVTVDSELPAAAALSDTIANPTTPMTGSGGMLFNGTDWRRMRQTPTAVATIPALGVPPAAMLVCRSTDDYRQLASPQLIGDGNDGNNIAAVATEVWNGATYDRMRGDVTNGLDVDVTRTPRVSTATLSNVASSASSVTIDALNTARLGMMIHNDSTAALYIKYGATASLTSYSVKIKPDTHWEMPEPCYTGVIDGIWAAANGNARVTEMTA